MFNVIGEIEVYSDQRGLLVKERNVVTKYALDTFFNGGGPFQYGFRRIAVSTKTKGDLMDGKNNATNNINVSNFEGIIGVGYRESDNANLYSGVYGYTYVAATGGASAYGQYNNFFPYTGVQRTFSSIGIVYNYSINNYDNDGWIGTGLTLPCYAYSTLSSPVVQKYNENLVINYKITLDLTGVSTYGNKFPVTFNRIIEDGFLAGGTTPFSSAYLGYARESLLTHSTLPGRGLNRTSGGISKLHIYNNKHYSEEGSILSGVGISTDNNLYQKTLTGSVAAGALNAGKLAKSFILGSVGSYLGSAESRISVTSPIQNVYSHNSSSVTPLYDVARLANSTFKPITQETTPGTWSEYLPVMYTYKITGTGYKIRKQYTTGYKTFQPLLPATAWATAGTVSWINRENGFHLSSTMIAKVSTRSFFTADNTGFSFVNLNGTYNNTTVTNLNSNDITVDNGGTYGYIASPNLGLIRVDLGNYSYSVLNATPCYGVATIGSNIVAIFNDGIGDSSLNDWSLRLTDSMGLDWTKLLFVVGGSTSILAYFKGAGFDNTLVQNVTETVDIKLINVVTTPGTASLTASFSSGNSLLYPYDTQYMTDYYNQVVVHWIPENSKFLGVVSGSYQLISETGVLTGLVGLGNSGSTLAEQYPHYYYGNSENVESYANFTNSTTATLTGLTDSGTRPVSLFEGYVFSYRGRNWLKLDNELLLGIGKGDRVNIVEIIVPNYSMNQILNTYGVEYYWDGSTWVAEADSLNPVGNSRAIHTDYQTTMDGLKLKWEDQDPGNTVPPISGQYYTQIVFNGALLDGNHQDFPINVRYTFRRLKTFSINKLMNTSSYDAKTGSGDSLWFAPETTDRTIQDLYLDGTKATVVGGLPNAGQIQLVAAGTITVNAADVGKTITGSLYYYEKLDSTEIGS